MAWAIRGWKLAGETTFPSFKLVSPLCSFSGNEIEVPIRRICYPHSSPSYVTRHLFQTSAAGSYFLNLNNVLIWKEEGDGEIESPVCQERSRGGGGGDKNEMRISPGSILEFWKEKNYKPNCAWPQLRARGWIMEVEMVQVCRASHTWRGCGWGLKSSPPSDHWVRSSE